MSPAALTRWIRESAQRLGFDLCGMVSLDRESSHSEGDRMFSELAHLSEWLARGYAGEMKYLLDPRRLDPRHILDGARSLIVVAINYNAPPRSVTTASPKADTDDAPRGRISRYAWGDDYHEIIQEKLQTLIGDMRAEFPEPFEARAYVDTGPILERIAAKYAGLGWLAKNTLLINQQLGSWLFLGVVVTTLALEPTLASSETPPADLCGSCTRCLDACPTQAFPQPYVLDARRCISYLTIELRGAIPEEFRPQMGNAVIGCDICQDVCPWNRKSPLTSTSAWQARDGLVEPDLERLASLSQEQFSAVFRHTAVKRAKWRGLVRNACVALGNSAITPASPAYARVIELLDALGTSDDPLIAEHARWALSRLADGANRLQPPRAETPAAP
ncbi:MAG TPA: tRNA epoxyqueuosine(34) reductase QueG [Candidatus Acidoferrum sp.]|nr:tRNA epoxyqueuosine(34) reductase QueG [Candidatus Acidoferrum sp.]